MSCAKSCPPIGAASKWCGWRSYRLHSHYDHRHGGENSPKGERTPLWQSSRKASSTKFGPNVVTLHVPDPTPDERSCLPRLFWQALADPWHQRARGPGAAALQAPSVSPGDDPEPLALVRL